LSTIRNADKIILLRKGLIAEEGTHNELIAKGGAYHKLVERQLMTTVLGEEVKKTK
jgi:ATP-binding cassette subfamily B protein